MKQTFFAFCLLLAGLALSNTATAQCDGQRYFNPIFSSYDSSTVVYSTDGMTMDIYQPHGDASASRKAILLIHGGNFYQGSSRDPFIYDLCQLYVQKGYVMASINYPLLTAQDLLDYVLLDSSTAYPVIARTISEGKAAVRYLKKNATSLGIDSSWIVIGGESSGALVADHVAYMNDASGVSPLLDSIFTTMGGLEGNKGNPGFSSSVKAVLNYGGALLSLDMLTAADHAPMYTAQGDSDQNVPYLCGPLFDGYTDFNVCGGGAMKPVFDSLDISNTLMFFDSLGYSPWLDSTVANTGLNHIVLPQVEIQSTQFLYQIDCPGYTGINELSNVSVSLYPNPASGRVNIRIDAEMESVALIDRLGRIVKTQSASGTREQIDISSLSSGIYLAKINLGAKGSAVRSFVVE